MQMELTTSTKSDSEIACLLPSRSEPYPRLRTLELRWISALVPLFPRHAKGKTYFPIGKTRADFYGALKSKAKYVPDEIRALFVKLKPYKRGNPPLWALTKLANTPKHVTIVHPGIMVKDVEFVGNPGLTAILRHSQPKWNSRKNEIVIARVSGQTTIHHDVDISLGVAFGKVPIFSGLPVLGSLRYLAANVERILWAMESEAKRIGVIK